MNELLEEIRSCTYCKDYLELGPRPVLTASKTAEIVIIGQAPGTKVHKSGIPWDDASGKKLREWLQMDEAAFYNESKVAIIPMGFCYPGAGKTGDLPPRKECSPLWHDKLFNEMPNVKLILLIGMYAQKSYLKKEAKKNLTENVRSFEDFGPKFFPLPHPSPRNRRWFMKNDWFEEKVLPSLHQRLSSI